MNYEIVTLEQKTIAGLTARTANSAPDMGAVIGGLWQRFFAEGLFLSIPDKANNFVVGLYSDYSGDAHDAYDITVGCEVMQLCNLPEGGCHEGYSAGALCQIYGIRRQGYGGGRGVGRDPALPLPRSFTGDFEEYVRADENGDCEVHIYVALE